MTAAIINKQLRDAKKAGIASVICIVLLTAYAVYKWWNWQPSYPLNNLESHVAMIKARAAEKSEKEYEEAMEGKIVTWKGTVEHSDGKKGRLFVLHDGSKYYVFVTFKDPTNLELNKVVTIQGRVTDATSGGTHLSDAVIVP